MKTVRFNNKIAALKRLKEAGIKDEKDLQAADLEILLSIQNITVQELKILSDMKNQLKKPVIKIFTGRGGHVWKRR